MALYGRQVRELIGEDIEEYLLDSIDGGYIDLQKAEIFTEVKIPQSDTGSKVQI